ncbi:MAG: hypothetical protein IPJ65_06745 [Archangiaceae bacterium]|nr:hypothetical protein [Archangiaceae bacterium]
MRALLVSLVVFFSFTACPPPPLLCGMGTHEEAGVCVVDPTDAGSADAGSADAGSESDAGSTDAGLPDAGPLPPLEMEADCAHQLGGAPGPGTLSALSEAHISVRFFGPFTRMGQLDDALAMALGSPQIDAAALARYGAALPGVCALPADPRALPAARVERVGPVAVIHPGTGSVSVPSDATAVAVDLRGCPTPRASTPRCRPPPRRRSPLRCRAPRRACARSTVRPTSRGSPTSTRAR